MNKARRHIAGGQPRGSGNNMLDQPNCGIRAIVFTIIMAQRISDEPPQIVRLVKCREPLKTANADMAVRQADKNGRARWAGFIAAMERFPGFDNRKGPAGLNAQRFEHFCGQNFTHRALQRQSPVPEAAIGGLARPLGAQIHEPACRVAHLGKKKSAAVANIGVVHTELMAVIAQGQRMGQASGEGIKATEMRNPLRILQRFQTDLGRRPIVAESQYLLREAGGHHRIGQKISHFINGMGGLKKRSLRESGHATIWGLWGPKCNIPMAIGGRMTA